METIKNKSRFWGLYDSGWHSPSSERRKSKIEGFLGLLRAFIASALICLSIGGCKTMQYVPIETATTVNVKDSTVLHIKDSIRITERTRYKEWAGLLDTLKISSSRGTQMKAWNDTTIGVLAGELREPEIKEKIKIVFKDKIVYKDSIRVEEKPVPVEVTKEIKVIPKFLVVTSIVGIISIVLLLIILYLKIKKIF